MARVQDPGREDQGDDVGPPQWRLGREEHAAEAQPPLEHVEFELELQHPRWRRQWRIHGGVVATRGCGTRRTALADPERHQVEESDDARIVAISCRRVRLCCCCLIGGGVSSGGGGNAGSGSGMGGMGSMMAAIKAGGNLKKTGGIGGGAAPVPSSSPPASGGGGFAEIMRKNREAAARRGGQAGGGSSNGVGSSSFRRPSGGAGSASASASASSYSAPTTPRTTFSEYDGSSSGKSNPALEERLSAIEAKLDKIMAHLGIN
ncbi:hypothetical protein FI667_g12272, partial [Globisporangium splendens]